MALDGNSDMTCVTASAHGRDRRQRKSQRERESKRHSMGKEGRYKNTKKYNMGNCNVFAYPLNRRHFKGAIYINAL